MTALHGAEEDRYPAAGVDHPSVTEVDAWLTVGRDVLLRGEAGSGRTTVIRQVHKVLARRRATVVLLRASGASSYESLLAHEAAPTLRGAGQAGATLVSWLVSELDGPRPYLLVDDVDLMDPGTVAVITRALRRTDARLVMTSAQDVTTLPERPLAVLIAERAPAEVRTRTLGFVAMNELVSQRLGGVADVSLVSSVAARSAGNPRVASALVDAARVSGVIGVVDGTWAKLSTLDEAPMDSVVHALLGLLPREEVRALETLAWTGPLPLDRAVELHESTVWEALSAKNRVVMAQAHDGVPVLAVSPPALAQGLRARIDVYRQQEIVRQVGPCALELDPAVSRSTWEHPTQILVGPTADGGEAWRRTVGLDGLVREKSEAVEAMERSRWQAEPTVANANRYLKILMRRPCRDAALAVFARTTATAADDPGEHALYAMLSERWRLFDGDPVPVRDHDPAVRALLAQIDGLRDTLLQAVQEGARGAQLTDVPQIAAGQPDLDGWVSVLRASTLLEAGRLAEARLVCERETTTAVQPRHYLDAVMGEVLIAQGDLEAAMRWSRARLDSAYEDLDQLGVRAHMCVLAEALAHDGQWDAAWQVVSASLQLGPAGVLENTFYRRTLSVAAMLRAHVGDGSTARSLLAELDRAPVDYHPAISSLAVLGRATLDRITGGGRAYLSRLWDEGVRLSEQGRDHVALMHWVLHPGPLDEEQIAVLRRTADRAPIPVLEPYVALHEAMTSGDPERVRQALSSPGLKVVPGIVQAAIRMVGDVPRPVAPGGRGPAGRSRPEVDLEILTRRERQIAALAREGAPNKDIADALLLSRRTVENHMSHVLSKLGLTSRAQLQEIARF